MDKKLSIIVPPQNKGWILDTMAQEIASRHTGEADIFYHYDHLPTDRVTFVMHYSILPVLFALNPGITEWGVFYTHESAALSKFAHYFNACKSIIVPNDRAFGELEAAGVTSRHIHLVPEGDDPQKWPCHRREERRILISHAYYPRKNPDLIYNVIKAMPDRQFLLLGKNWEQWERFSELEALPNLEIKQNVPYFDYPSIYATCDVYFSASITEGGGPHSLIEAMLCNMVPVVSRTGNYREYITNTYNGFTFELFEKVENIVTMLQIAFAMDNDISQTVQGFTWNVFSKEILDSLWPDPTSDEANDTV